MKKNSKKFLIEYIFKYKIALIISLILAGIAGYLTAIGPKELGKITTIVYKGIINKINNSRWN